MRNLFTLILLGIILVSCNSDKTESEKNRKEQIKYKRDVILNKFIKKYNIIYQWDTLHYKYSFEYKPVIESKYQIINHFVINDIYEKNDTLFLSINAGFYPSFYFDFPITREQVKIFKQIKYNWSDNIYMVVRINKLKKIQFNVVADAETESDGDDSWTNSWIEIEPSDNFIGKGKIIEIETLMN